MSHDEEELEASALREEEPPSGKRLLPSSLIIGEKIEMAVSPERSDESKQKQSNWRTKGVQAVPQCTDKAIQVQHKQRTLDSVECLQSSEARFKVINVFFTKFFFFYLK